jgi:hypothetical protein
VEIMDRTTRIIEGLTDWQTVNYEEVATPSDIRVFNSVGILVTLLSGGFMSIINVYDYFDLLSLDEEEKKKITSIYINIHNGATKEEVTDGKENN